MKKIVHQVLVSLCAFGLATTSVLLATETMAAAATITQTSSQAATGIAGSNFSYNLTTNETGASQVSFSIGTVTYNGVSSDTAFNTFNIDGSTVYTNCTVAGALDNTCVVGYDLLPGTYVLNGTDSAGSDSGTWNLTVSVAPLGLTIPTSLATSAASISYNLGQSGGSVASAGDPTALPLSYSDPNFVLPGGVLTYCNGATSESNPSSAWTTMQTTCAAKTQSGISVHNDGSVDVAAGTAPGDYTLTGNDFDQFGDVGTWSYMLRVHAPVNVISQSSPTSTTILSSSTGTGSSTTSASSITSSSTTLSVASDANFPQTGNYNIWVNGEEMTVTGGQGTTTWTVTRAVNNTSASSAASGTTISLVVSDLNVSGNTTGAPIFSVTTASPSFTVESNGAVVPDSSLSAGQAYSVQGTVTDPNGTDNGSWTFTINSVAGHGTLTQTGATTGTVQTGTSWSGVQLGVSGATSAATVTYSLNAGSDPYLSDFQVSPSGLLTLSTSSLPAGQYVLNITATDQFMDSGSLTYALTVTRPTTTIVQTSSTSASMQALTDVVVNQVAQVGIGYLGRITTSGSDGGGVTFTTTSNNVVGASGPDATLLSVDPTTGIITAYDSIIPNATYTISGTDTDQSGDSGSWTFSLTVTPANGVISVSPVPEARVIFGQALSDTQIYSANELTGGAGTVSFSEGTQADLSTGQTICPAAVTVGADGTVSMAAGSVAPTTSFTGQSCYVPINISDVFGDSGSTVYQLQIAPFTSGSISASGNATYPGSSFSAQISPSSGTTSGAVTYVVTTQSPAFTVSTSGAVSVASALSASPTAYTVSGTYSDSYGDSGTWTYALTVGRATPTTPSISNLPTNAAYDAANPGTFTANVSTNGDGTPSFSSSTTTVCTVDANSGRVTYVGAGICTLSVSIAQGTNYFAANGSSQSFSIAQTISTAQGQNVQDNVSAGGVTGSLTFSSVTSGGMTTIAPLAQGLNGYVAPANFSLGSSPIFFDINTQATFTGPVTVCFTYPQGAFPANTTPSLMHYTGGQWIDVTTNVDTNARQICGSVTSFSPLAVGLVTTVSISNLPANGMVGGSFTANVATNGDGTSPTVTSNSPSICSVAGLAVHYVGAGTCSLVAHVQAGTNYAAADGLTQTFVITSPGLTNGMVLTEGHSIPSSNGQYNAVLQNDGNFVVYGPGNRPLWADHLNNYYGPNYIVMQGDGNLVDYLWTGLPLWSTSTSGTNATTLKMFDDGVLALESSDGTVYWTDVSGKVANPAPPAPPSSSSVLSTDGVLSEGQALSSGNGFTAVLQNDGNFVIYGPGNRPLWADHLNNYYGPNYIVVQPDGNMVDYLWTGLPLWSTHTSGANAFLEMQGDGNLVLYSGTHPLWASGT